MRNDVGGLDAQSDGVASSIRETADSRQGGDPIAVVGMACRFPRAPSVEDFWRLLEAGESGVIEGDPGSGVGRIGELFQNADIQSEACRFGAYLEDIDQFDAEFFRISPVEAQHLDPQQRLMLETSWQALEDAGIDPERLKGSKTGVYAGISNNEYRGLILESSETSEPAASLYSVSGTSFNTAAGRVSFALGLQGPAMAIDTACSSSLVAVHQAAVGLQRREADVALAGGVHTILSGRLLELRGNAGMLAPDGRCKTFDAAANGYVRGEGCGILVLKRLRDAEADGDRIWGVIRGSALNQDGASPGLTVPNEDAQKLVIEEALAMAGVKPADVDYLEAHGTGTEVGDPIELRAAGSVYGQGRDDGCPLLIGSVKTNVGHLESAAGVAGLMKVLLAMNHSVIPKHLNFRTPTPEVNWGLLPLRVTSDAADWPRTEGRRPLAGVSGFGWSGTNAHVVVEGYPQADGESAGLRERLGPAGLSTTISVSLPESAEVSTDEAQPEPRRTRLLPLSGRSDEALTDLADRHLAWLDACAEEPGSVGSESNPLLADMAWTASVGRSHFPHRSGLVYTDAASLREKLQSITETPGQPAQGPPSRVAFAYTGQGSQWVGMGRSLYETEPVVRTVLERCEAVFQEERGASLLDVMFGREGSSGDLNDTAWAQPTIYALECALTALWASVGVRPSVVVGHSLGEIAAAQAAGVFSLEDGMRFVTRRGALLAALPGAGSMAAIFAPEADVTAAMRAVNGTANGLEASIAADNGAHQVVSGPSATVEAIAQRFESQEVRVRRLNTSQAFHSVLVEPVLDDLEGALADIETAPPSLALVSNVTGQVAAADEALGTAYWRRHVRQPVAFRRGVKTLSELGVDIVVEIGPHAVLGPMASLAWPESSASNGAAAAPTVLASLRRPPRDAPTPEPETNYIDAVAEAYEAGMEITFEGLFAGESRRRISVPGYPFQRRRHWVDAPRRRRPSHGHPLLGLRHESARGEVLFETEVSASDPAWLDDHRVFGRVIAPGALFGAMAASAIWPQTDGSVTVDDLQLHSPLVLPEDEADSEAELPARRVQVVLDREEGSSGRRVELFSRGEEDEDWTLHVEARVSSDAERPARARIDVDELKSGLTAEDASEFYGSRAEANINLGPRFRTLQGLWSGEGEAVGEIVLPESVDSAAVEAHPILLDGCFQVMAAARSVAAVENGDTYLPFGWERLWLAERLPDRVFCHARMRERPADATEIEAGEPSEVLAGDLRLFAADGTELGGLNGYTVKRATRSALLSGTEGLDDLLYQVVWRDRPLAPGMPPADFLPSPEAIARRSATFSRHLAAEGVGAEERSDLLNELELLSRGYALSALEQLDWKRTRGDRIESETLRQQLGVMDEHQRLFRRLLEMLARAGVLDEESDGFVVAIGAEAPLPDEVSIDPDATAVQMAARYDHGSNEIGLFRRSAGALADVLHGRADPLTLLFSSGEPSAADLYLKAPVARAANRMLGDAVAALLADLPDGRRLRVLEVGAGTGSATASVLPELPSDGYDYVYTDISAGFFAEAEARFGGAEAGIDYRVLDIEVDPETQGYALHGYDLIIASNVLHATRYLEETLAHCRKLLAPSGQLVALENLRGQGWLDLTFGQLDGWWRFADDYRPHHALAGPAVWRQALADAGFVESVVLGVNEANSAEKPDRGVIVAQGPEQVAEPLGLWILAADQGGVADELAMSLASRNQTVVLASPDGHTAEPGSKGGASVVRAAVEPDRRESWKTLLGNSPEDAPLKGIVHFAALDGHGAQATAGELATDSRHICASALALVQGIADADLTPENGLWFVTQGGQVLEHEHGGQLAGALLWGIGKVVAREAVHLQPRMIDLDPGASAPLADLANEFMYPDAETHLAYRLGVRQAARLVRFGTDSKRLAVPETTGWLVEPDAGGDLDGLYIEPLAHRPLQPREVRVAVEAAGLNFWDLFRSLGVIDEGLLGGELCGQVLDVGPDVSKVAVGDRVVGLAFGSFGSEVVTHEAMLAPAPAGIPVTALATMPTAFVSAALSFDAAQLKAGDRVLIHAGAGGVGMAAIQLAQTTGAEVFATASAPKQAYLRSIGVEHVFDSRQTRFGEQILQATDGAGVDVVLNSLTGEGFIDASLSCLARGGRFVELARVDVLSYGEMSAVRPDVAYKILELDVLKEHFPEEPGAALREVMDLLAAGKVHPVTHTRWSMSEVGLAMKYMGAARHIGKIVLATSPIEQGQLRADRSYLVTGGLGGIGCAVAGWLADKGAGTIVLNGRREPDDEALEAIEALRRRGVRVEIELADVTDAAAIDAMFRRIDANVPPLAGVIHSVGVLSDAALTNQSWERFERVLWPKVLGAWQLHLATMDVDLDLFVLYSSVAGVLGNPGQANHSAANAFLDQLAGHRRALGLPGQSIAWGAWSGLGEAEEQRERIAGQLEASGTGWITPQQGLRAFEALVRHDVTSGMVAAVDWPVFADRHEHRPPLLEDLLATDDDSASDTAESSLDLVAQLQQAPEGEREGLLVSFLQGELQAVLRLPTLPSPSVGFFDLGMDSLMAVELRNRLNRSFAEQYVASNTLVFDYPDAASLARHLAGELGQATEAAAIAEPAIPEPEPRSATGSDGIAIVGMACRFPGADDPLAFWRQLEAGVDAVSEGRQQSGAWYGAFGDPSTEDPIFRRGAFLEGLEQFDSRFFRIAPIEARLMDPRQRLLLETTWHALEDAAIDPDSLRGSRTGVYIGVGGNEYRDLVAASGEGDSFVGTAGSMTVGRVSYVLGLEGPAMPLDMVCASSLVAVHQAIAGLERGEADMALVGGVNVPLSRGITQFLNDLGMLSKSGCSRTFDASADGFVRSDGCGMVVLKRLRDAEADGDRIWGVIRGSAINQNGASAGLTVPNGPAQEQVLRDALSRAGIEPADVDYLEAHGAGSALGDPIEVQAAASVYGQERDPDRPLLIGSVKANIGHLEWAAGIASLIKTVLAMHQRKIPRQLHYDTPSPQLDWDRLPVRVVADDTPWPQASDRGPVATVSAFGMSGTNANVVVQGYDSPQSPSVLHHDLHVPAGAARQVPVSMPDLVAGIPVPASEVSERKTRLLPVSAKSDIALREVAKRYLSWLDDRPAGTAAEAELADLAWTAAVGRSHFDYRRGLVFRDTESLRERLLTLAEALVEPLSESSRRVAFAYSGHGGQWVGMGEDLYQTEPVVQAVLDHCDEILRDERGASLLDVMFGREGAASDLDDPSWAQPAVYALECALTALWASIGIRPTAVVGEGVGEVAAAQAAGVVSLEDGLRFASARGALLSALPGAGLALEGSLEAALRGVSIASPTLNLVSSVTGRVVAPAQALDAAYWHRQIREPVEFTRCVETLADLASDVVVEVGPDDALRPLAIEAWPNSPAAAQPDRPPVALTSLRRPANSGSAPEFSFADAVAIAYEAGLTPSFSGLFAGETRRRVSLPSYPFQRRHHWV